MSQPELGLGGSAAPDGVEIRPTPAMHAGKSYVAQCAWCGLLICVHGKPGPPLTRTTEAAKPPRELGPCPACGCGDWWAQHWPVGPFRPEGYTGDRSP